MAQDRKLGARDIGRNWVADDHSHDDFWGRELVLEVDGAYLFEAPQSGVKKIPRFPDATDATSNDNHCDNDARCDSGAHYTDDAHQNPKNNEDNRYEPNMSRRRRPCASDPTRVRSHMESIGLVGKPKNDWKVLWGLRYTLIFEALELVLILSLTIAQIGTAFLKSVSRGISWWLDDRMPRTLEMGHKKGSMGTKD
jgi:hypothetical protein